MLLKLITSFHLLIILCNFSSTEFVPRINCSSIVDVNCECSFLHEFVVGSLRSFVELECVEEHDYLKRVLIKNENNEVSVTCHGVGSQNFYHLMPTLNIDSISTVILDCPMTAEMSIKNVTNRMGINSFNHLAITTDQLFEDLFNEALNITKLDVILAQDEIELFPTKFLSYLSNLESLHFKSLDGRGSTLIETGIFNNQSNLKSVKLADVVIKELNKELLAGASSIINLEFRYSSIELITADAFEQLTELKTLTFYFTRITTLPDAVLRKSHKLKDFRLKSNALIDGDLMANLTSLTTVDISACGSPILLANLFAGSLNIVMISLTQINMITISSEIFKDQVELMELDLSSNTLLSLPSTIFKTNKKLQKLNLGYNMLQTIPQHLFASTEKLTELNLEHNKIQQISNGRLICELIYIQQLFRFNDLSICRYSAREPYVVATQ